MHPSAPPHSLDASDVLDAFDAPCCHPGPDHDPAAGDSWDDDLATATVDGSPPDRAMRCSADAVLKALSAGQRRSRHHVVMLNDRMGAADLSLEERAGIRLVLPAPETLRRLGYGDRTRSFADIHLEVEHDGPLEPGAFAASAALLPIVALRPLHLPAGRLPQAWMLRSLHTIDLMSVPEPLDADWWAAAVAGLPQLRRINLRLDQAKPLETSRTDHRDPLRRLVALPGLSLRTFSAQEALLSRESSWTRDLSDIPVFGLGALDAAALGRWLAPAGVLILPPGCGTGFIQRCLRATPQLHTLVAADVRTEAGIPLDLSVASELRQWRTSPGLYPAARIPAQVELIAALGEGRAIPERDLPPLAIGTAASGGIEGLADGTLRLALPEPGDAVAPPPPGDTAWSEMGMTELDRWRELFSAIPLALLRPSDAEEVKAAMTMLDKFESDATKPHSTDRLQFLARYLIVPDATLVAHATSAIHDAITLPDATGAAQRRSPQNLQALARLMRWLDTSGAGDALSQFTRDLVQRASQPPSPGQRMLNAWPPDQPDRPQGWLRLPPPTLLAELLPAHARTAPPWLGVSLQARDLADAAAFSASAAALPIVRLELDHLPDGLALPQVRRLSLWAEQPPASTERLAALAAAWPRLDAIQRPSLTPDESFQPPAYPWMQASQGRWQFHLPRVVLARWPEQLCTDLEGQLCARADAAPALRFLSRLVDSCGRAARDTGEDEHALRQALAPQVAKVVFGLAQSRPLTADIRAALADFPVDTADFDSYLRLLRQLTEALSPAENTRF